MEGFFGFIASVNKISLIAFIGVFGFLLYEVWLLRKEHLKKQKPTIPQFDTNTVVDKTVVQKQAASMTPLPKKIEVRKSKASPLLIGILVFMTLLFLGFSLFTVMNRSKTPVVSVTPTIFIQEISSPGLKVFDNTWTEIVDAQSGRLTPGTQIYIGIQTIVDTDVDRARIKINEKEWNIKHITNQFNKEKNVYYREYIIATGESSLKIDAQLHSETDGWLGD